MDVAEPTAVVLLLSLLYNATSDSLLLHTLLQLLLNVGRTFVLQLCIATSNRINIH